MLFGFLIKAIKHLFSYDMCDRLATIQLPVTFPLLILFRNEVLHLAYCIASSDKVVFKDAFIDFDQG